VRPRLAGGDQRNVDLCGWHHDRLQLICKPLGGQAEIALLCVLQAG
jgi:hypothetical protein